MPYAAINDIQSTLSHEHVLARNMIQTVDHSACGEIKLIGSPVKYSEAQPGIRTPPPTLGEHTVQVLEELGMSKKEIEALRVDGVVA